MVAPHARFGVWALVQGSWASHFHPEDSMDASWERNRKLIQTAEKLGFESTLVAQHTINPRSDKYEQLEAWTASAALAAVTDKIEIITAIKPFLYHPVVLAKMALQIEDVAKGRFAINFVNAWFKPELDKAGLPFPEHDQRYDYGGEWLRVVRDLMEGKRVTFRGEHFQVDDYLLSPGDRYRARPTIYAGGESEPARQLVNQLCDVWFINGQPLEDVKAMIDDMQARGAGRNPVRYGMAAYVIARATRKEAEEELAYAFELKKKDDEELAMLQRGTDRDVVMMKTSAKSARIGTNGGTAAGLVGSYDEVAERIHAFSGIGIETFMLQFQPVEREMERFAANVIPRVRRIEG